MCIYVCVCVCVRARARITSEMNSPYIDNNNKCILSKLGFIKPVNDEVY
jgi:hypothetical protein